LRIDCAITVAGKFSLSQILRDEDTRKEYDAFIASLPARLRPKFGQAQHTIREGIIIIVSIITIVKYLAQVSHSQNSLIIDNWNEHSRDHSPQQSIDRVWESWAITWAILI
jgi:hypothetical protein